MILIFPVTNFKVNYETKKCELNLWNIPILKHFISKKVWKVWNVLSVLSLIVLDKFLKSY